MNLKYRTIFENSDLQKVKLKINDWAGTTQNNSADIKVQPYMCKPFVDASTYGFEILYPYETTIEIEFLDGKMKINAEQDWKKDQDTIRKIGNIPVGQISENHFGINTGLDIKAPAKHVLRIEPHPAFYGKNNYPCAVPGHLETDWWSSLFFIVIKAPEEKNKLIFYKGMPIAQCIVLPKNNNYVAVRMSEKEANQRRENFKVINTSRDKISKSYKDINGNTFDNTYKTISNYVSIKGIKEFKNLLNSLKSKIKKIGFRLFKK